MAEQLGRFEQLLLFALLRLDEAEEEPYGVTLRQEIEQRTGRTISSGAVYTALRRLEERGYVSSWTGEPTPERGGRRKKHYRLEPEGLRALHESYREVAEMAEGVVARLVELAEAAEGAGEG